MFFFLESNILIYALIFLSRKLARHLARDIAKKQIKREIIHISNIIQHRATH